MLKKFLLSLSLAGYFTHTLACTAVALQAQDGSVIVGRTMEWAFDMHWQLAYYPAGTSLSLTAPANSGHAALHLTSKYAVFGVTSQLAANAMLEGQNAAGLAISANFLPGFTQYQTVLPQDKKYASVLEFSQWLLSSYASVAEVKQELVHYKIWGPQFKNFAAQPTLHFLISDKSGASAVIEYVNGELRVYAPTVAVMTNAPTYDWHLTNIRNYLNLSNIAVNKSTIGESSFTPLGQGGGGLGLPGDYTPPARFIRTFYLKHYATTPANAAAAVALTGHILNNVDIPQGVVTTSDAGQTVSDYTQWVAIKDLSHNQFYFADYNHRLNFVKIDLTKIFAQPQAFTLSLDKIKYPTNDITSDLIH